MANYYVRSGAAAGGNGTTWTLAYQTLTLALAGKVAGDIFYVADDHAETSAAAVTLTVPSNFADPTKILCVNRAGSVPPVSADLRTTATVTTTGASALSIAGGAYIYGITFACGTGSTAANLIVGTSSIAAIVLVSCKLRLLTTATASRITSAGFNLWINVTVEFGIINQGVSPGQYFYWRSTVAAIAGSVFPSQLLLPAATITCVMQVEAVDLSALLAGKSIIVVSNNLANTLLLKDCKLGGAAITSASISASAASLQVDVVNCDSADTVIRNERYRYEAAETTETTIVRIGGASDGTTTISRKVVTTGNVKWQRPYEAMPIAIWNETVGSAITLTVECISSAVLNNDDIWMDVEYLGTSGFPLGVYTTTGKADVLATGVANTTSTETWGGALTGKFKLVKAITAQGKGWIYVYPKVAKASTTVYIDPEITVT